jgi:type IV secretory pathway VirB10-like protein
MIDRPPTTMRIEFTRGRAQVTTRWTLAAALAVSLAGCSRARPALEPDLPPLAAPLPPPRLLPPLEGGPIEGAVPTTAEEPPADPRPTPRRREPRPAAPAPPDAARTEAPGEAPVAEAAPAEPAPVLQLTPPGEEARVQQAVRQQLAHADRDLSRVDYRALGADARAQYETAKRFAMLAEQALRDRNLVFAQTLADKAAAIAAVLAR